MSPDPSSSAPEPTLPYAICSPGWGPIRWVSGSVDEDVATTPIPDEQPAIWYLVQPDGTVVEIPDGAAVIRRDGGQGFAITMYRALRHPFYAVESAAPDLGLCL